MILYHGTSKEKVEAIKKEGFSEKRQGENGSHFGSGIYLATTKKRAKAYGKHLVSVEINDEQIAHITGDWLKDYQDKCQEVYEAGIPANQVNTVVGEWYKKHYFSKGYTGIMLDSIIGTSKEIVVYDTSIISRIS